MSYTETKEFPPTPRGEARTLIRDAGMGEVHIEMLLDGAWSLFEDTIYRKAGAFTVAQGKIHIRIVVTGVVTYDYH